MMLVNAAMPWMLRMSSGSQMKPGVILRSAVADHDWQAFGLDRPLTATIGLSSHMGSRQDGASDFLRLADMALLAAKDEARNCVRHADPVLDCPVEALA